MIFVFLCLIFLLLNGFFFYIYSHNNNHHNLTYNFLVNFFLVLGDILRSVLSQKSSGPLCWSPELSSSFFSLLLYSSLFSVLYLLSFYIYSFRLAGSVQVLLFWVVAWKLCPDSCRAQRICYPSLNEYFSVLPIVQYLKLFFFM